jgi:formylglycine-generating enzyme required for sulfatase activity
MLVKLWRLLGPKPGDLWFRWRVLGILAAGSIVTTCWVFWLYGAAGFGIFKEVLGIAASVASILALGLPFVGPKMIATDKSAQPKLDPAKLVEDYLAQQRTDAESLPIEKILGPKLALGRKRVSLSQVFVPMEVSGADPEAIADGGQERRAPVEPGPAGRPEQGIPLAQALAEGIKRHKRRGLRAVLVAEAGSGKSTVVGDLLLRCPPGSSTSGEIEPLPDLLADRHVLRVNLKGLNRIALPVDRHEPPDGSLIWQLVRRDLCACTGGLDPDRDCECELAVAACKLLRERLAGRGLLLLDALDEVLDKTKRALARQSIMALDGELEPGCAVLVTARPYAFDDGYLDGFQARWTLRPLRARAEPGQRSQVLALIERWFVALSEPGDDRRGAAERLADDLSRDPQRAEMAEIPLLLTLLIGVAHDRRDALPTDRSELFEAVIALVLDRWLFQIRSVAQIPEDLTTHHLRAALQRMALGSLRAPARLRNGRQSQTGLAVSAELFDSSILQALGQDLDRRLDPAKDVLRGRAGVLRRLGLGDDDPYEFIHRQFQEYLAGCELVRRHIAGAPHDDLAVALRDELSQAPGIWREVARFAILRLARGDRPEDGAAGASRPSTAPPKPREAIAVLDGLLRGADDQARGPGPAEWEGLAVAALALADLDAALSAQIRQTSRLDPDLAHVKQHLDGWLWRLVGASEPPPGVRLDFGRVAGRLGDPRPYILPAAWTPDPRVAFTLDPRLDFDWVEIPAGRFRPGSDRDELQATDERQGADERDLNPSDEPVAMPRFDIARYPVTQAQFAAFVRAADGYGGDGEPPPCWRFARDARPSGGQASAGDDRAVQWWRQSGASRRARWRNPDQARADLSLPNHPVIGVAWYEAMAFCHWLTLQPQAQGVGPYEYRLPTEIQWERAARGIERRRWPWGDDWIKGAANTQEAGLGAPAAVGLFPAASPEGLRDMAGNVYEWTATRWGPDYEKPKYGWPLDPADDRDDPAGADLRIVRGGSWYNTPRFCRGSFRLRYNPSNWHSAQGFRVVRVSLAYSDS